MCESVFRCEFLGGRKLVFHWFVYVWGRGTSHKLLPKQPLAVEEEFINGAG